MKQLIRTVLGDLSPEHLGWCQSHEHIFIADGPSRQIDKSLYMSDYAKSLAEVVLYRRAGGQSLVDAQPFKCGRMAEYLVAVSQQTDVNIIACTGFHKVAFFEDKVWLGGKTEDALTKVYTEEITDGMYASDNTKLTAKAGIIKCAAVKGEDKASKAYERLFSAVRNAAAVTGAPIMVHMDKEADALRIISFFEKNKIKPEKMMFCHLDRTRHDYKYHEELANIGAFLEYDTIHRLKYHDDEKEARLIAHMVDQGYGDRLLLSLDTTNRRLKSYGADFGLDYILTEFKEVLRKYLSKEIIDQIMINNPAKALGF